MSCPEGCTLLFAEAMAARLDRLAGSPMGRLLPGEKVADLFCGAGGWTASPRLRELGVAADFAVNHSPIAIEFHRANSPETVHTQGDAWKARPRDVIGKRTKLGLLLASAACTTHSNASGGAPISPRVHMLGVCILRWMREAEPRCVLVENVPEWRHWGPLIFKRRGSGWAWDVEFTPERRGGIGTKRRREIVTGPKPGTHAARRFKARYHACGEKARPVRVADPARKGQHFTKWLRYCRRLGYAVEWRILDAADFGNPSRRKRLFVMMRRDGQPIVWPEVTHGSRAEGAEDVCGAGRRSRDARGHGAQGGRRQVVCGGLLRGVERESGGRGAASVQGGGAVRPYRTAAEIIDWSDLGTSIFTRPRPLKDKTLRRIAEGIVRFVLNDPEPFVLRVTHGDGKGFHVSPVSAPAPTQTTRQDVAVCTPILAGAGGPGYSGKPTRIDRPGNTVLCEDHRALVAPLLAKHYGGVVGTRLDVPAGTVTTVDHHGLVSPVLMSAAHGDGGGRGNTGRTRRMDSPLGCIHAGGMNWAAVSPVMAYFNHGDRQSGPVGEPMRTVVAQGGHAALVAAFLVQFYSSGGQSSRADRPLPCITTIDRHGLVVVRLGGEEFVIVDILFRMLRPHELAAAMGFPAGYVWPRSQRDAVRLIGNAVAVPQAEALVLSMFPGYRTDRPQREAMRA